MATESARRLDLVVPVAPRDDGAGFSAASVLEPRTQKELRRLFRQYTEAAALTLASLAGNPETPAAVRVMACKVILDRGWGATAPGPSQAVPEEGEDGAVRARPLSEADLATMSEADLTQVLMETMGQR